MAHFSAEETEPQRLNNMLKVTDLKCGSGRVQTQACLPNFKGCVLNHCVRQVQDSKRKKKKKIRSKAYLK